MKYPLVPLVTDLTFPPLFFLFCLPFVMLLILTIILVQIQLNEAQVPSVEEINKQSPDEPDSDSKFEDESTEQENQDDASSTELQEETKPSSSVRKLKLKPAYLNSTQKSQKQSLFAEISDGWFQRQKIRYSDAEKSDFCNTMMLLCTVLSSLTWNFGYQLLQISNVLRIQLLSSSLFIYVAQLFILLSEKALKILDSLRMESRGLFASVLGRKLEKSDEVQRTTTE